MFIRPHSTPALQCPTLQCPLCGCTLALAPFTELFILAGRLHVPREYIPPHACTALPLRDDAPPEAT